MAATSVPTIFLSAASIDLKPWRETLHKAFSRAGFRVFTQSQSLGAAPGDVRQLLVDHIRQSDCVIHLAGIGYGFHAQDPFPADPAFQCSWTQFEYYFAHSLTGSGKKAVIAYVCDPDLSTKDLVEEGDATEQAVKRSLQDAHRDRVRSGEFTGTPLEGVVPRTSNESIGSVEELLQAVAAAVGTLKNVERDSILRAQQELQPIWHAPQRVGRLFGRQTELATLQTLWDQHPRLAITGSGGMGKTALAAELLETVRPLAGKARRLIAHDYYRQSAHESALAALLSQAGHDPRGLNLREMESQIAVAFNQPDTYLYLEGCEKATDLPALLALTGSARVLLTTRDQVAPQGAHGWGLPPLSIPDAAALVHHLSGRDPADPSPALVELAQFFGGHALACQLAGNLLSHRTRTASALLKDLQTSGLAKLGGQDKEHGSVDFLLRQTAAGLEERHPGCARLWYALGLGALSPLPLSLLAAMLGTDSDDLLPLLEAMQHEGIIHMDEVPPESGDEAEPAAALAHALIQTYAHTSLCQDLPQPQAPDTEASYTAWREAWANYLKRCFDSGHIPGGYRRYEALLPQLDGLLTQLDQREAPDSHPQLRLINSVATLHHRTGRLLAAEPLLRRTLEVSEQTLGKEHPDTLMSLNNLASLLWTKGDLAGAEPLCRRALEAQERELGAEHPATLGSLSNLANLLIDKGDLAGAEPLHRRTLEVRERTLGAEHPDTLSSLNNLAILLKNKGDLAGAEPLYRRALEALERKFGAEHPDTLMSLNNLANLLVAKGDLAGAEPLYRRALEACERTLLPEHPARQGYERNLAWVEAELKE